MAVTLVIYGEQTTYDPKTKRTDSKLTQFEVELFGDEDWKAPLGFNVSTIRVKG